MKRLKTLLILLLCLNVAEAKDELVTYSDIPVPELGYAYNGDTEAFMGACADGTLDLSAMQPTGSLSVVAEVSQSQIEKDLGIGVGTSYRSGAVSGSASADYSKATKKAGHSISMTYRGVYDFGVSRIKDVTWDDSAKGLLEPIPSFILKKKMEQAEAEGKDPWTLYEKELFAGLVKPHPDLFVSNCGKGFVVGHKMGALIFINMRFDFESASAKEKLGVKLKVATATTSFSAELKNEMKESSKRSRATVNVLQIGGRVEKVSQIFGKSNESNDDSGYRNFINCSFGEFEKCSEVFIKAIQYAGDVDNGFPSQLNVDPQNPDQSYGPSILGSFVRTYDNQFKMTEMSEEGKKNWEADRKEISSRFESSYDNWVELDRMLETALPRIPENQRSSFDDKKTMAKTSMTRASNALDICYHTPHLCDEVLEELRSPFEEDGMVIYQKEDLHVPLESFAQYCDYEKAGGRISDWQDRLSEAQMHSIRVLNELAQAEAPSGTEIAETADPCLKSEEILKGLKKVDLSFERVKQFFSHLDFSKDDIVLKDLTVLKTLPQINELNLSGHNLEDSHLQPLAELDKLRSLDLSNNRLVTPEALNLLTNLKLLDLGSNNIADARFLLGLTGLQELNLTNNQEGVICPTINNLVCLIMNFDQGSGFTYVAANDGYPRVGHVAVPFEYGVFVIGGYKNDVPLSFVSNDGFTSANPLEAQMRRTLSTATKREDGKVVLFGGVDAVHTLVEMELGFTANDDVFIKEAKAVDTGSTTGRYMHQATLLADDSVLITGGYKTRDGGIPTRQVLATTLKYSKDGALVTGPGMRVPRTEHQAIRLSTGQVLITGGLERYTQGGVHKVRAINSAEIYNPATNQFESLPSRMKFARYGHQMTLIGDDKVLITGGFIPQGLDGKADNSDFSAPVTENAEEDANSAKEIDQQVLKQAEIFDLKTKTFTAIEYTQKMPRANHQAVSLDNGMVLLVGGLTQFRHSNFFSEKVCKTCTATAEIYDPMNNRFFDLGSEMRFPRAYFTASPITDRRILIIGGKGEGMRTSEIFEYNGLPTKAELQADDFLQ